MLEHSLISGFAAIVIVSLIPGGIWLRNKLHASKPRNVKPMPSATFVFEEYAEERRLLATQFKEQRAKQARINAEFLTNG